jgi:uncharacterized phage protein (TIGR01671 family)
MRTIKFRVFNRREKTMFGNFTLGNNVWQEFPEGDPNYEIMQFTGLTDKNGKEIYEGDVVKLEQWNPKIWEVIFNRGGFCFRKDKDDRFYNDCKYLEDGEVIGNIYENPELMARN